MQLHQRLHHHAGIDLEHTPDAVDVHEVDRGEGDADGLGGVDGELCAGCAKIAVLHQHGLRARIEIVPPTRATLLAVDDEWHIIEQDHAYFVLDHGIG